MNIEQAIDILKNSIADYVIGEYCEKCADNKICDDRNEDCYYQQAIDTVVTAYEKEKEKNKEYTMKINNLISQIESAIDFMKTYKLKIKVDMYQQKEEAEIEFNKYALVVLKKMLQELLEGRK